MNGVKEVRAALMNVINSISFGPALVTAAPVLALVYPALHCVGAIRYIGFISILAALMYGPYLVGLILCFAKGIDWAPGAAFCIQALRVLIGFLYSPSVQEFLYLILYIALAVLAFMSFASGSGRPGYSGAYHGSGRGGYGSNGGCSGNNQGSYGGQNGYGGNGGYGSYGQGGYGGTGPQGASNCPKCGALIEPGSAFCTNCGNRIK